MGRRAMPPARAFRPCSALRCDGIGVTPTRSARARSAPAAPWWRQVFHWQLFTLLAAVHLFVLPLLFSERSDDIASIVAGLAYLTLALADRRFRTPAPPVPF